MNAQPLHPRTTDLPPWCRQAGDDLPLPVTGTAFPDSPMSEARRACDLPRTDCMRKHPSPILDAIAAGIDVRGHMLRSLPDRLEPSPDRCWRFGMIHVDDGTQRRPPKDCTHRDSGIIRSHGCALSDPLPC
ncbi:MAG TPA: family 1 glycosylhydrolase [Luteimonas sp.]|nr:family 1 glycosylhydrolase [Luteimonas sp.]HRO26559.1 family 1 glycosylhydrolase [Luteimonas sp.]HRP72401.1 family 1 glycosylhydrolase [Luteimonas sp.]